MPVGSRSGTAPDPMAEPARKSFPRRSSTESATMESGTPRPGAGAPGPSEKPDEPVRSVAGSAAARRISSMSSRSRSRVGPRKQNAPRGAAWWGNGGKLRLLRPVLLQHGVEVGPPEAERAPPPRDGGAPCHPGAQFRVEVRRAIARPELRPRRLLHPQRWRQHLVVQREGNLDQPRHPRAPLGVADHRFHGADGTALGGSTRVAQRTGNGRRLGRSPSAVPVPCASISSTVSMPRPACS